MAVPVNLRQRDMAAVGMVGRGGDFSPLPAGEEKPRNALKSLKCLFSPINPRDPKNLRKCLKPINSTP